MRRAWIVWAPAAVFFGYAFFLRTAPSVMAEDLMRDFQVGAARLGNLSAFYFYSYAAVQIAVGVLVDGYGPRRVLSLAALAAGAGVLVFALATDFAEASAGRLLIGAGAGFGWVASVALVARWFAPRRFALVAGLTTVVGMIGAAGGQAPLAAAVEALGWRTPMIAAGGFGAVLSLACWLIVRDRPGETGARAPDGPRPPLFRSLGQAARNRQTWLVALYTGAQISPFLGLTSLWGVPYLMHVHALDRADAAAVASAAIAGMAAGAPFLGWLSDRIGRRKPVMILALACQMAAVAAAFHVPGLPVWTLPASFFVLGFFSGAIVVGFATAREANGTAATGAATAIVNTAVIGGGAAIQPAIGALLDRAWTGAAQGGVRVYDATAYGDAFMTLHAAFALALLGALTLGETRCGVTPRTKK